MVRDEDDAVSARSADHSNVLCLGARVTTFEDAQEWVGVVEHVAQPASGASMCICLGWALLRPLSRPENGVGRHAGAVGKKQCASWRRWRVGTEAQNPDASHASWTRLMSHQPSSHLMDAWHPHRAVEAWLKTSPGENWAETLREQILGAPAAIQGLDFASPLD